MLSRGRRNLLLGTLKRNEKLQANHTFRFTESVPTVSTVRMRISRWHLYLPSHSPLNTERDWRWVCWLSTDFASTLVTVHQPRTIGSKTVMWKCALWISTWNAAGKAMPDGKGSPVSSLARISWATPSWLDGYNAEWECIR